MEHGDNNLTIIIVSLSKVSTQKNQAEGDHSLHFCFKHTQTIITFMMFVFQQMTNIDHITSLMCVSAAHVCVSKNMSMMQEDLTLPRSWLYANSPYGNFFFVQLDSAPHS